MADTLIPPDIPKDLVDPAKAPPKVRLSPAMRKVIELMVWEGCSIAVAAERADITKDNAQRQMHQPKYKAYYSQQFNSLRENSARNAFVNIHTLANTAKSEDVRLRANTWLAGVAGIAPTKQVQVNAQVSHSYTGFDYSAATIDGEASEVEG